MDLTPVKSAYIAGDASLAALAQKYNLSVHTLHHISAREGWVAQRKAFRDERGRKLLEQRLTEDLQAAAALDRATVELSNWLTEIVLQRRAVWQADGKSDLKQLRDLVACTRELDSLIRSEDESAGSIEVVFAAGTEGCCG